MRLVLILAFCIVVGVCEIRSSGNIGILERNIFPAEILGITIIILWTLVSETSIGFVFARVSIWYIWLVLKFGAVKINSFPRICFQIVHILLFYTIFQYKRQ